MKHCKNCGILIEADKPWYSKMVFCNQKCSSDFNKKEFLKLNRKNNIPSGSVGAMHELVVSADLIRRGFNVFRALSPSCPCDLAIIKDKKLYRVEVTTGYLTKKGIIMHINKDSNKYDLLVIVHNDNIIYKPEIETL